MYKLLKSYPKGYARFLIIAYILPLPLHFLYTVAALIPQGLNSLIGGFIGCLLISFPVHFPFNSIYYAILTFLTVILDQALYKKTTNKQFIKNLFLSFALSGFTILISILLINHLFDDSGIIWALLLIVGFISCFLFTKNRMSSISK